MAPTDRYVVIKGRIYRPGDRLPAGYTWTTSGVRDPSGRLLPLVLENPRAAGRLRKAATAAPKQAQSEKEKQIQKKLEEEQKQRKEFEQSPFGAALGIRVQESPVFGQLARDPHFVDAAIAAWNRAYPDVKLDKNNPQHRQNIIRAISGQYGRGSVPDIPIGYPGTTLLPGRSRQAGQATPTQLAVATSLTPQWAPYADDILIAASKTGVPWQLLYSIAAADTGFDPRGNGGILGFDSSLHGAQYEEGGPPWAPIKRRLASPEAAARVLKKYYDRYQDWALAAIAYRFGEAAADRLASGTATPQERALYARQVGKWYSYLSKEGLGFNDVFSSPREVASGAFGGVGGGGGGASVSLLDYPDWTNVRQFAEQTIKSLYFRDPHPGEVEALVGMVKGAIDSENARRQAAAGGGGTGDGTFTPGVAGGIVFPVQGGAKYGNDWHAPRDGGRRLHQGIDLVAPQGTPAVAAVSGTIIVAGYEPKRGGNRVWIKGDDGRYYYYAHLDKITVTVGQHVTAGEQVGTVGTTGNAKGGTPHLHFAISVTNPRTQGESYINPYPILKGAPQAAAVSGGNAPQTFNDVSPEARIVERLRGTPEYQRLYAKKPSYLSEADYAKQFIGAGQELLGKAPGNEAVRVGLETGSLGTTVGYVSGGQEALQSGSFIGRLFAAADVFNRLL